MRKEIAEQILKLNLEKQVRCGDGVGKTPSHSMFCKCEDINKQLAQLHKKV